MTPEPEVLIILGLALLGTPVIGWWAASREEGQFLSAGRRITLPVFVATLVCTWYGGILGVGEFTWTWGLVNWLALGVFYYVFALLYAWLLAGRVRDGAELSIPERIGNRHGRAAGKLAGLYTLVMVTPAPYLLMTAILLERSLGLSLEAGMGWALILTVFHVWRGGLRSVLVTDMLQFFAMFLAFIAVLVWLVSQYGGVPFLVANLPPEHLRIPGALPWSLVLLWGLVAVWTIVDPGFHQRVAAARDPRTARRGILISVGFWVLFDGLTTACGLYARALLPDLAQPVYAFPELADLLPPVMRGIFYAGMLVTVLSTLDSFSLLSGLALARDVLGSRGDRQRRHVRWAVLLCSWLAAMLALKMRSVVELWLTIASLGIPVLLPVLLHSYLAPPGDGSHSRAGLVSMGAGALVSIAWFTWGRLHLVDGWPDYPLGLDPIYPGLVASLVGLGLVLGVNRRRTV